MPEEGEAKRVVDKFVSREVLLSSIRNELDDDYVYVYQQFSGGRRLWCSESLFPMLKQKIQRLHELTRFSTYYELFGVRENAAASEVKRAFRKLKKLSAPSMLSREQYDELLMNGYNVLNTYRGSYDKLLRGSRLYFFDDPANYRNHVLATSIAFVCALLCLDFVIYALRYLRYMESENAKRPRRSEDGRAGKPKRLQPPTLCSAALLIRGAKLLGVRK